MMDRACDLSQDWVARYSIAARDLYREILQELAALNPSIVCLDADHGGFAGFAKRFPDRYFDVGIAEANMVSIAAGLAAANKIPFVNTMASFVAARACEQVKVDVAYARANVKIVATHSGLSGGHYGPTHHSLEDVAIMRAMPHMTIIAPADACEAEKAIRAVADSEGPAYIRLGRRASPLIYQVDYVFEIGRAVLLASGSDIALAASGAPAVAIAMRAAESLRSIGIHATVLNIHTIKPLDIEAVCKAAVRCGRIITIECHSIIGGLGSAVAEVVAEQHPVPVHRIGIRDTFCEIVGTEDELLAAHGVSSDAVVAAALVLTNGRRKTYVSML
jgi:transketolase